MSYNCSCKESFNSATAWQMMLVQAGVNTSTNQSSVEVEMVDRGSVDEGYVSGDSDSQSEYDYEWMESNVEKDDTEGLQQHAAISVNDIILGWQSLDARVETINDIMDRIDELFPTTGGISPDTWAIPDGDWY